MGFFFALCVEAVIGINANQVEDTAQLGCLKTSRDIKRVNKLIVYRDASFAQPLDGFQGFGSNFIGMLDMSDQSYLPPAPYLIPCQGIGQFLIYAHRHGDRNAGPYAYSFNTGNATDL